MKRFFPPSHTMRRRARLWERIKDSGPAELLFFFFLIAGALAVYGRLAGAW